MKKCCGVGGAVSWCSQTLSHQGWMTAPWLDLVPSARLLSAGISGHMHLDQVSTQPCRSSSSSLPPLPMVPSPLWTAAEGPAGRAAVPPWISAFSKKGRICILGGCNEGQVSHCYGSHSQ